MHACIHVHSNVSNQFSSSKCTFKLRRLFVVKDMTKIFEETHGNGYMRFQYCAYWNELLLYFIGVLCFLATIKVGLAASWQPSR